LAPQLRYLEIDLAGTGLQRPLVTASTGILPSLTALVTSSPAKLEAGEVRNVSLLSGLTVTAEMKVGHRSVISYFLYPLLRGLDESIREP
jgi:hemolysin D